MAVEREQVRFRSGNAECAAWHYPGTNGVCVVMAGGYAITKEPGTDRFAERFAAAGYTVLAFDHRRLGESGGTPRQVIRLGDQVADWMAALQFAAQLPGVDGLSRVAAWSFSITAGHVIRAAARTPGLGAAIAQTPSVDGAAGVRLALRYQSRGAMLRLMGTGLLDAVGGRFGAPPRLVPLVGGRGELALLTCPDAQDGERALDPDGRYRDWLREVAARSVLGVGRYRPGKDAARVLCPLLVVVAERDNAVDTPTAEAVAARAPRGEVLRVAGGHYAPFLAAHEQVVAAELDFLRRHLVAAAGAPSASVSG